jgi:hypothetical protein
VVVVVAYCVVEKVAIEMVVVGKEKVSIPGFPTVWRSGRRKLCRQTPEQSPQPFASHPVRRIRNNKNAYLNMALNDSYIHIYI